MSEFIERERRYPSIIIKVILIDACIQTIKGLLTLRHWWVRKKSTRDLSLIVISTYSKCQRCASGFVSCVFFALCRINEEFRLVKLSDLRIIATLGVGGFGRVELVQIAGDASRSYALKQMKKSQVCNGMLAVWNENISCLVIIRVRTRLD